MRQYGVEVALAAPLGAVLRDPAREEGSPPPSVGILRDGSAVRAAMASNWQGEDFQPIYHQVEEAEPEDWDARHKDARICVHGDCKAFRKHEETLCARHYGIHQRGADDSGLAEV